MAIRALLSLALVAFLALTSLAKSHEFPLLHTVVRPKKPKTLVKTFFTNGVDTPSGWKRQNSKNLGSKVSYQATRDKALPPQFRSYARRRNGFTYLQKVKPGTYRVVLGFAEFQRSTCVDAIRVFSVQLNGKSTDDIDVHKAIGCRKPYTVAVDDVVVGRDRKLLIKLTRVIGTPFLSNFQVIKNPGPSGTVGPTPSSSPVSTKKPKPSPGGKSVVVLEIDAGGNSDRPADILGKSNVYPNFVAIAGTDNSALFSRHRFGITFTYVLPVKPRVLYDLELLFAESYTPGCVEGFRVFDIAAYDGKKAPGSGKSIENLDVFKEAGCRTALTKTIRGVSVGKSGLLAIKLTRQVENAMISGIKVTTADPKYGDTSSTPTPDPTTSDKPTTNSADVNVGGPGDIAVPGTTKSFTALSVKGTKNISPSILKTARFGSDFQYSFDLAEGAYDILLGFSENFDPKFCSEPGKRVFNVYINDLIQLEGFDIFAKAGCRTGLEVELPDQTVGSAEAKVKPLTIRFSSVANFAQVNYIKITPGKVCIPESTTGGIPEGLNHAAHSVPGSYPPQITASSAKSYVDSDGNGFFTVNIDGGGSHSHFFDAANGISGRVTDFTWTIVETGKVISKKKSFKYDFPLGTTRLKLAVLDNSCTRDEAETTVTVTGSRQPGQYCYYYSGLTEVPFAGEMAVAQHPSFASISPNTALGFPNFSFDSTEFAVRCTFFLEVDEDSEASKISIVTGGSGVAKVYKGEDLLIDSASRSKATTSLSVGLLKFEVVYLRTSLAKTPKLNFLVNDTVPANNKIFHDRTTVRPILTSISPSEGKTSGGTMIKVSGYGLYYPFKVSFGDENNVPVKSSGRTSTQFFVQSPAVSKPDTVQVSIKSRAGITSNSINFSYGSKCDSILFTKSAIVQSTGGDLKFLVQATSLVIGQDGKIYIGTLNGAVQVVGYNSESLTSTSHCYSKPVRDARFGKNGIPAIRAILGITFDPSDKELRPYVSTSTFYWLAHKKIEESNKKAWQNGAIDRLRPGTDPTDKGVCLVYDKRIVSNLPVSNHDHSVNHLLFTQDGDLLVSVGGFTNMGLPGFKLGGYWETDLSATILIARLSKPGFDGNIVYNKPDTPRLAKKISGDVDIFVSGVRNSFAMTMTGKGDIYATDNGPNCKFGDIASTCSDYNEAKAAKWDPGAEVDWQGQVKKGWADCPYSLGRPDKVLHIKEGRWYGHPNLNHGGKECAWIDPYDHKTIDDKPAPSNYEKPMVTIKSAVTGISEYRANHFCGKLRGELILSTYKDRTTYRMGVNGDSVTSGPDAISDNGGLAFVETHNGDLIFAQILEKKVFVLRPKVSLQASLHISGAIPFRHGKKGGTLINIGGGNFGVLPTVKIGSKSCTVKRSSETEIVCVVPPNKRGLEDLSVTSSKGERATLPDAVLYMNV